MIFLDRCGDANVNCKWLAWTGRLEIHWIVPVLSGVLFGLAYVLSMVSWIFRILGIENVQPLNFASFVCQSTATMYTPLITELLCLPPQLLYDS